MGGARPGDVHLRSAHCSVPALIHVYARVGVAGEGYVVFNINMFETDSIITNRCV